MEEIKVKIAGKTYNVKLAQTDEEKEQGLQGVTSLADDEGMLFSFDDTEEVSIWMKDTVIPLDIIFIDLDLTVKTVFQGVPRSEDLLTETDITFVLEVNIDSGIKIGDELEFSPNSQMRPDRMAVLNVNGTSQMQLQGGERIFSRDNTKTLIRFAKKATQSQSDNDYKALGKRVFKFIETQNENEPEYVENKN